MTVPFWSLTIPVDSSPQARHSIDFALRIAPRSSRLHFCSIVDPAPTVVGDALGAYADPQVALDELEAEAAHVCADAVAAAQGRGFSADAKVMLGAPAATIAQIARENGSDAIVLCTHGRRGLTRAFAGSVSEDLMAQSTVPVIITHLGDTTDGGGPVTVALDGSPASDAALGVALRIAAASRQTLAILHVVEPGGSWAAATPVLTAAAERARSSDVDFELITLRGKAPETIVADAQRRDGAMIVIGTRGHTGIGRMVLGSVAAAVVERAPLPVIVVRPDGETAGAR